MASTSESLPNRRRRVTYNQLEVLWDFLNTNKEVALGYNKSAHAREHSRRMWENVSEHLNAQGEGAVKSGKDWCTYWVDYKSKLKRRASTVRLSQTQTGGGPPSVPPLSDIEKKFISIMGEGYGSGLPNVQVDPFAPQAITSSAAATEGAMVVWPADSPNLIESISRQEEVPSPAAVPPVIPQQEGLPTQPPLVQPLQGEIPLPRLVPRVRSRRRRGMSKEEARRQLVQLSQERLAVDQERLAVDQERLAVDQERLAVERENAESLKQILIGINKIADKMDRRTGGRETSDEGASSS
ncbi:myb/SANT-like DNA-binding domain-containing protein 4 isoform X1 [Spodoptera frugiperda]|uniref:Regulatory protein zeste n=1 Tax=Spodoptera frugiperda TaxID=7108 RepID=A0A9R0E5K1_SPOFR|nr:myb/SANT-like DNA-binding domain-containing protein 4 isoform X3 [Spodoptera frugiperda]XP_050559105.1 myb/SANT-like DNA-binding domain-containing protein 4 isoform X1 [Spodoptera frugiperda]